MGTPLGKDCYKIRMSITSKNSGKSGGARIIAMAKVEQTRVILLYIIDKSEEQSISNKVLNELIKIADDLLQ